MISIFPEMARSPSDVVGLGYPIIDKWCTKAVLSATLNGSYTAEFTIPHKAKGVKRELLPDVKQVIKLIDMDGDEEYFRVRRFKHNLKETVITAEHISYDLIDNLIEDINNVDKDGQGIMDKISAGTQYKHPFRLTSDILKTANIRMVRMNPIQALIGTADNTFVNRLGGELKRKQFTLAMNESIGIHRTDVIRSRRNLTGFEREINLEDYATRIMPRAKNGIELPEKYVDSPHIAPDHPVIKVIDYSDVEYDGEFKDLSDSDKNRVYNELRACAKADFAAGRDVPNASYEVDFITLRNTVEYADYRALENYNLGDTVSIYEADYNVEIEAKVISFEWDILKKRYTSMKLGSFKNGIVRSNFNKTNSVDAKISQAQSTADIALLSADGKTTNFYGTGEPVNPKKGDTWFKKNGSEEEVWQYQEVDGVMMWVYVTGTRYANALKESIAHDFSEVTQQIAEQQQEHDRQVADILSKTQSVEALAKQAKTDAASAIARANQVKTEAIADARAQVATVSQALNTAKSELQTAIASADQKARDSQASATALRNDLNSQANKILAQAQAQTALTNRVTTVETLADGTRSTVTELSKTVNKATGDIASVTSRTKTVEDTLSQTRTQYEALTQTINAQTGQIDSINRKTADLQSGIDGVINRFETIWVSEKNLLSDTETLSTYAPLAYPANNYLGRAIKRITKSANTSAFSEGLVMQTNETLVNPKEMILSFYVKANRDARIRCFMYNPNANKDVATSDGYTAKSSADGMAVLNVTTSWQRVWIKWTYLVNYFAKPRIIIGRILETYDTDVSIDISAPALYHGHHNKEWSPADLDFKNELATYVQNAQESSADLARRIETADGKAVDAKAYAQQTANGFNTRIESLESYKNAEGTRASQYLTASRAETAKQITAERTAIANDYVAKSIYDENVRGTTLKLDEIKSTAYTAKQNLATYQNTVDRKLEELTSSTQTLDGKIDTASTKVDTVAGQIRTEISEVEGKIPTTIGATNYIRDFGFANNPNFNNHTSLWKYERIADSTARSGYHIKATCTRSGSNGFHRHLIDLRGAEWQGRTMTYSVDVKASKSVRMRLGVEAFNKGYKAFDVTTEWQRFVSTDTVNFKTYYSFPFYADTITWAVGDIIYIRDPQLEDGSIATTAHAAEEDLRTDISSIKTTITQTSQGVEQLSTSLSTTNNKVSTAETKISQLISDVSSKVSQTDYDTLTGRMSSAETLITQNATEISKRLTKTEVDKTITGKGYQTKSDVDSNITGRGYITSSALQPYALATTVQTLVKETADSFSRTISETKALIPSDATNNNLWVQSRTTGTFTTETLPSGHVTGQSFCYKILNNGTIMFHIEPDFSSRLYRTVTFSAWVKYENVVSGANSWNKFNCFKHRLVRKNSTTGAVTSTDHLTLFGFDGTSDWKYIKFTYDFSGNKSYDSLKTDIFFNLEGVQSGTAWVTGIKIELGDKATPYSLAIEDLATVTALHSVKDAVDSHTRTIGAVGTAGSILDNVSKVTQTAAGLVQEVSGTNGLKTQVGQLKDSWAVKLSGPGGLKTAINASTDGIRLLGKNIRLDGNTLIDNGVIKSAMIGKGQIGTAHIGEIDAGIAKIVNLDVRTLTGFDAAFIKGKFDNVIADLIKGKNIYASNGNMNIDLQNGMIIMHNSGKFIINSGYAEFARQKGLIKASLAFRDSANTNNGIKLSVDDGLGKSTSVKHISLNAHSCYVSDFDEIFLKTSSGNWLRITDSVFDFKIGGFSYSWNKSTFEKIAKL
ncbi:TPA: phage tail protein [Streptococcus suis]|nr:phage tail protein [Streptococcus suis]